MFALALAFAAGGACAAEPLGRLFFTPAQRAQLDAARTQKARLPLAEEKEEAPAPEVITFRGVVRRSDGRSTVWLNDRAIEDGRIAAGIQVGGRVRPDGRITLEVPQSERRIELRVGQSVELGSGTVEEPYRQPQAVKPPTTAPPPAGAAAKPAAPQARDARRDRDDDDEPRNR
jgi:hypothetical protein